MELTKEQIEREKKHCKRLNNNELMDYATNCYKNYILEDTADSEEYDRYWIARNEVLNRMRDYENEDTD